MLSSSLLFAAVTIVIGGGTSENLVDATLVQRARVAIDAPTEAPPALFGSMDDEERTAWSHARDAAITFDGDECILVQRRGDHTVRLTRYTSAGKWLGSVEGHEDEVETLARHLVAPEKKTLPPSKGTVPVTVDSDTPLALSVRAERWRNDSSAMLDAPDCVTPCTIAVRPGSYRLRLGTTIDGWRDVPPEGLHLVAKVHAPKWRRFGNGMLTIGGGGLVAELAALVGAWAITSGGRNGGVVGSSTGPSNPGGGGGGDVLPGNKLAWGIAGATFAATTVIGATIVLVKRDRLVRRPTTTAGRGR